jgi:hypothetical protein
VTILASAIAAVLFAIAALHAYWGVGGVWPGSDARSCARTVGGFPGATAMPGPMPCFAVAAAILIVAIVALAQGGLIRLPLPDAAVATATFGAALVFVARGVAGYTSAWRQLTPEQPFATLDMRYYSPLSLAIGVGLLALLAKETAI